MWPAKIDPVRTQPRVLTSPLMLAPCLAVMYSVVLQSQPLAGDLVRAQRPQTTLQETVEALKATLSIEHAVVVSVVATNVLALSVAAPSEVGGPFQLAIEAAFLGRLTDDELTAALAHELGHVWIFAHHPYLQTERLANEIAMRAVTRENLERVYEKVWKRVDTKGDISQFLGPKSVAGLAPANDPR